MPVRLDRLAAQAPPPRAPRLGVWLAGLALMVPVGVGAATLLSNEVLHQDTARFWGLALGGPLLAWSVATCVRAFVFMGQKQVVQAWNAAREDIRGQLLSRGRRSQQVLAVSVHTALRSAEDSDGAMQRTALLAGTVALKSQAGRSDSAPLRHSRLVSDLIEPAALLEEAFARVLGELAPTLAKLPQSQPLAVLLEVNRDWPEDQVRGVWQQAWGAAGICQSAQIVAARGLAALDQWLDERIADPALLLVVALQLAPQAARGTGEAAVGVLLGNRLTQGTLVPAAFLHRPEQERDAPHEVLDDAVRRALDWALLPPCDIEHLWRAAVDPQRNVCLASAQVNTGLPFESAHCSDLDGLLGHTGCAAPWLAIAIAAQAIERGAKPHFIFSGDSSVEAGLWCTVVTPVAPLPK